ncbi:MAG: N-acetylmuramoyl-L-alanine amidase-like domain-containing protein [Nitrospirota bacterium]
MKEQINLGKWTEEGIGHLLKEASVIKGAGSRIAFLSGQFLKTSYKENTLIGDPEMPEVYVINLEALDCFTFIDYIEAMRLSKSFPEFKENIRKVRYRSGTVSFENRNHFFTDWREFNSALVRDVTAEISYGSSQKVVKMLNRKDDGTCFLPGIAVTERAVDYIHSDMIDDEVIRNLQTGDYAGIYSKTAGLDISHAGIVIREQERVKFRHASSLQKHRRVMDEDLRKYLKGKPGIIVLRPLD